MTKTFAGDPQQIQATLPRSGVLAWAIPRQQNQVWSQPLTIDMWAMHPSQAHGAKDIGSAVLWFEIEGE